MIKIILLAFSVSILLLNETSSQLYRVMNQQNEPIPSVVVYDPETHTGDLTDEAGLFRSVPGKEMIFSSLGYLQDTIKLPNNPHTSLIILKADSAILNGDKEMIGNKINENKIFEAGNMHEKRKDYFYLASDDLSLLTKVRNPINKKAKITQVFYNLKIDDSYTIRVRILSVHPETGEPHHDLLKDNVIFNELNLIGNYQVDLTAFQVTIPPEGVYVGFDILPINQMDDLKIKVGLLPYAGKSDSYIGAVLLKKWTLFNTRLKYEEPKGNFMFGITASY